MTKNKNKSVGIAAISLILTAMTFWGFYTLVYPYIENQNEPATILWQGEITNKIIGYDIDHETFNLEINGSIWKQVPDIFQYNKYVENDYVYFFYDSGIYYLKDTP